MKELSSLKRSSKYDERGLGIQPSATLCSLFFTGYFSQLHEPRNYSAAFHNL